MQFRAEFFKVLNRAELQ